MITLYILHGESRLDHSGQHRHDASLRRSLLLRQQAQPGRSAEASVAVTKVRLAFADLLNARPGRTCWRSSRGMSMAMPTSVPMQSVARGASIQSRTSEPGISETWSGVSRPKSSSIPISSVRRGCTRRGGSC
jgi:hypothetical protein